jgi:hypothetical protein
MRDQKVSGDFPTLERPALAHLRDQFPHLRRKGFSAAIPKKWDRCVTAGPRKATPESAHLDSTECVRGKRVRLAAIPANRFAHIARLGVEEMRADLPSAEAAAR